MANATHILMFNLLVLLALLAGGVVLQIFLSRRESKWPGLVLPGITFAYSLVMVLGVASFDGRFPWGPLLAAAVLGNIPTLVLLAIYSACRERRRARDGVDKTRIEDL